MTDEQYLDERSMRVARRELVRRAIRRTVDSPEDSPGAPRVEPAAMGAETVLPERKGDACPQRPRPPRFEKKPGGGIDVIRDDDEHSMRERIAAVTGTDQPDLAALLLQQSTYASGCFDTARTLNECTAILHGIAPRNPLEGMLAAQMAITHTMAVDSAMRATDASSIEAAKFYGAMSVRLFQTFTQQFELFARVRGQAGNQRITVEHVTVEAGGQAVVGAVSTGGVGDGNGK